MNYDKLQVIKMWKEDIKVLLRKVDPTCDEDTLEEFACALLKEYLRDEKVNLTNTYLKRKLTSTALGVMEYFYTKKPSSGGNGVLFDRDKENPEVAFLTEKKAQRSLYKKMRNGFDENSYEFGKYELKQVNEKVLMNADYGLAGSKVSLLYNLECASATTLKGKNLTSCAVWAFESFIANNYKFMSFDDCLIYVKNIIKDGYDDKYDYLIERKIDANDIIIRLNDMMLNCDFTQQQENILRKIIANCDRGTKIRLYYKNNLFKFCTTKFIKEKWNIVLQMYEKYDNPDRSKTPDDLEAEMDDLWTNYLKEYVYYEHDYTDRVYRAVFHSRKVVTVIDTDSNMLCLNNWYKFVKKSILPKSYVKSQDVVELRHKIIYTFCFQLSNMIHCALRHYLTGCNVREDRLSILDMKNEYLFRSMITTSGKKNYASVIEYKEGKDMHNTLDIKGLMINKSSTNRVIGGIFKNLIYNEILMQDKLNLKNILKEIQKVEKMVTESLLSGSSEFLIPYNVSKPAEAYDDPLKEAGIRGAMLWNWIYPDEQINLPESFFGVKLNILKEKDLDKITNERVREIIREKIFNSYEQRIKSKGAYVIAIPRDHDVPEWVKPCIDIPQMVDSLMNGIYPISDSFFTRIPTKGGISKLTSYVEL